MIDFEFLSIFTLSLVGWKGSSETRLVEIGCWKGTVQYGPQRTDKYTKFVHEGLMENPCKLMV